MDMNKVREFVEFTGCMNFTVAARGLNLSQPALSKHIRDLEEELGVSLVKRGALGEKNSLTPAGQRFLERSRKILDQLDCAVQEARGIGQAIPPARIHSLHFVLNISSQLRAAYERTGSFSGKRFEYKKVSVPIVEALDNNLIDFAVHYEARPAMGRFSREPFKRIYGWIPLAPQALRILVNPNHPLANYETVGFASAERYEVVNEDSLSYESWYATLQEVFALRGASLSLRLAPEDPRDGGALPIGLRDLCVCTDRFAEYYRNLEVEAVRELRFEEPEPLVYPFLVYRRDNPSARVLEIVEIMSGKRECP